MFLKSTFTCALSTAAVAVSVSVCLCTDRLVHYDHHISEPTNALPPIVRPTPFPHLHLHLMLSGNGKTTPLQRYISLWMTFSPTLWKIAGCCCCSSSASSNAAAAVSLIVLLVLFARWNLFVFCLPSLKKQKCKCACLFFLCIHPLNV